MDEEKEIRSQVNQVRIFPTTTTTTTTTKTKNRTKNRKNLSVCCISKLSMNHKKRKRQNVVT